MNYQKYLRFPKVNLPAREWPSKEILKAPLWCSVDLRDGNQALEIPMDLEQKVNFFKFLVATGFKEIEVGCPAASDTEFMFLRTLIERNLIPDDVTIQVLVQSIGSIIDKTFESLDGVKKAVIHLYNSTSKLQRDVVFGKSREEIIELAAFGAERIYKLAEKYGKEHFVFQYSPESFSDTELDFAVDICNHIVNIWKPDKDNKVIINLPSTVEMSMPNIYADQIEYMNKNLSNRENIIISVHTHNDRGTAVAATELALLAGAERVEGTLFGNGERTGNADILTIALNIYSQGMDPCLDFSKISNIIDIYQKATMMEVHPRHPYAGDLVYTAFSGTHQDAIKKGMANMKEHPEIWKVPYLPIDPADIGRTYDPIIRINSQSGKGGISYILERDYGLQVPRGLQIDFGKLVTKVSDEQHKEFLPEEIYALFKKTYIDIESPVKLESYREEMREQSHVTAQIRVKGELRSINSFGEGVIEAFCKGISAEIGVIFEVKNYFEHSLDYGTSSRAITYVNVSSENGKESFGVGISGNITKSSLRAVVSAVNKLI